MPDGPTYQWGAVRTALEPRAVTLRQTAPPRARPDEVLVDVELCGLCGSDAHVWRGDRSYDWVRPGTILGHEVVGRVSATGSDVSRSRRGARVVPMSVIGCETCRLCASGDPQLCPDRRWLGLSTPGGLAATVVVPARALIDLDPDLPATTAVLTEPMSVAVRAVISRGAVQAGQEVVVSGPGTVGLLAAVVATHRGAAVTVLGTEADVAERGALCQKLGVRLTDSVAGLAPDLWVEASGAAAALGTALDTVRCCGRLVLVGLYGDAVPVALDTAVRRELTVLASYGGNRRDYEQAVDVLLAHPALGDCLVAVRPLDQIEDALDGVGRGDRPKIAVRPVGTAG